MSVHRAVLLAATAVFVAATTSAASAGCRNRGLFTSFGYAATGCGASVAFVYAEPVAPPPPPPPSPPVVVSAPAWAWGCGCGAAVIYAAPLTEPMPIAPAPIYVVNQGPEYSGPGILVPYRTWSPPGAYVVRGFHPVVRGYRYGYRYRHGRAYSYRAPVRHLAYTRHSGPRWHVPRPLPAWQVHRHRRYR